MGYVAKTITASGVIKAILQASHFIHMSSISVGTTWVTLFDSDVDLTDIDKLHYSVDNAASPANNGTLQFDYDGTTSNNTLSHSSYNYGSDDCSGYTTCRLKILIYRGATGRFTNLNIWGTKS